MRVDVNKQQMTMTSVAQRPRKKSPINCAAVRLKPFINRTRRSAARLFHQVINSARRTNDSFDYYY